MESALRADAAAGSSSGIQHLEAAVSLHTEDLFDESKTTKQEKLKTWLPAIKDWISGETSNPLQSRDPLKVVHHATFGKIKAAINYQSCTCSADSCASTTNSSSCSLHASSVSLSDLVWEVTRHVHEIFGDQFMAFASLFAHETSTGLGRRLRVILFCIGPVCFVTSY